MRVRRRNPDRVDEVSGPRTVAELLDDLDVNPHTVLVIQGGQLVTASAELADDAEVEIRPVISGGAGPMSCSGSSPRARNAGPSAQGGAA